MNYTLLQSRFNEIVLPDNLSDAAFLESYNAQTVEVPIPVLTAVFAQHCDPVLTPKLLAAESNPNLPPELLVVVKWALRLLAAKYDDFSMESADFLFGLGVLINAGVLTQAESDGILALGVRMVSQSEIDHGREATQLDLNVMRNQEKRALCVAFFDESRAAFDRAEQAIFRLDRGESVDLESEVFNPPVEVSDGD